MINVDEVRARVSEGFADADDVFAVSATLFDWRTDTDGGPDVDLLLVIDGIPTDHRAIPNLMDRFTADLPLAVNLRWDLSQGAVRVGLRTLGHPLTEIAHTGIHVAGTRLLELVPDPAPYDPIAVRVVAHQTSRDWAAGIRRVWDKHRDGNWLALVLQSSADVALMHQRLGRTASYFDQTPTARSLARLARIIGDDVAHRVAELITVLRSNGTADCSSSLTDVHRLMEFMLGVASDTTVPGCSVR